ncbi:MAG: transposase [Candidatus Marithrix sp.]
MSSYLLTENIELLRYAFRKTKQQHPFKIDAIVILPEHLHCILTLPLNDNDFSGRWRMIKKTFSKQLPKTEYLSNTRIKRNERGIWQRRFWEHLIHDEQDYKQHIDYIHFNPVKHGWVTKVINWKYSSFHLFLQRGIYLPDWGINTDSK